MKTGSGLNFELLEVLKIDNDDNDDDNDDDDGKNVEFPLMKNIISDFLE